MSETIALTSKLGNSTALSFVGKVLLWIQQPQILIDAGYTIILLEMQKKVADVWEERSKETTRITVKAGVYNYAFLDEDARQGYRYRPVLRHATDVGTNPDQVQAECPAVDASYELVLTVQEMQDRYLYGLGDALSDDAGVPIPDRVYVHYIQAAIAKFEQKVNVRVSPRKFEEYHDFYRDDAERFFAFWLHEFPIIDVEEIALTLPGQDPQPYPTDWYAIEKEMGQVHMLPNGAIPVMHHRGPWMGGAGGGKFLPRAFKFIYHAGFGGENGIPLPANIVDIIGKEASFGPLNLAGDLLGGAGIASQSISLDGLSTNFNTTSSATNAGFGARILQYTKELKDQYPEIIRFYKGLRMRIL